MEKSNGFPLPHVHYQRLSVNILNLTKKAWPLYLESRNYISICLVVSSTSAQTTKPYNTFAESCLIPSARIQRWALTLSAYNYDIKYKPGKDISNADMLSRLSLPEFRTTVPLPGKTIYLMDTLESTSVNATRVKN